MRKIIAKIYRLMRRIRLPFIAIMYAASTGASPVVLAMPTATTGDITGIVTDQNGVALSGIKVDAFSTDNITHGSSNGVTWTAADGTYDLANLPTGAYKVLFNNNPNDTDPGLLYATQWYNNQIRVNDDTAELVRVTAGMATPNIDDSLAAAGVIAGKVVDQHGNGIAGIKVDATTPSDQSMPMGMTFTNPDGTYYLNIIAGDYLVRFNQAPQGPAPGAYYIPQWYNDQPNETTANPVTVTTSVITNDINATLAPAGAVSGRLTDEDGNGLANSKVEAYPSIDAYNNSPGSTGFTTSDQNGDYYIGGLPAGDSYIMLFDGNDNGQNPDPYHLQQFYSGKSTAETADPVTITENMTTTNIDGVLPTLGAISGKVFDANGVPVFATVSAYLTANDVRNKTATATTTVNPDGSYRLIDMPAGQYYVAFAPQPGYLYKTQFYDNQSTVMTSTKVAVTKGNDSNGINATLAFLTPTTGSLTVHSNKFQPACMGPTHDVVPGVCEAAFAGLKTSASADVNVQSKKQGIDGTITFTSRAATHVMTATSTSLDQLYAFGDNNESVAIQGVATVTVDGVTTTNLFRVIATDNKSNHPKVKDQFGIFIWAPDADPNTSQPLYYMNEPLTNGNVIVK